MRFVFEQIRVGGDRNFAYLVGDRDAGVAAAIDPAFDPDQVFDRARTQGLETLWILNTHGRSDHTNGNERLAEATSAEVCAHRSLDPRRALHDGDALEIGSIELRVLEVPGHTTDHLLFWLPEQKVAITGDLLFVGKIGGTATEEQARAEDESLQRVLATLPDDTTIWPGHDYGCRPATTIALERIANPFLLAPDFDAFFQLKRDWADYKARLGLR